MHECMQKANTKVLLKQLRHVPMTKLKLGIATLQDHPDLAEDLAKVALYCVYYRRCFLRV